MATRKTTKKKSPARKAAKKSTTRKTGSAATSKKQAGKKSRSSPGIISKATKVVGKVFVGAVSGAAMGAVAGAADAGSKATGIGKATRDTRKEKSSSGTREAE